MGDYMRLTVFKVQDVFLLSQHYDHAMTLSLQLEKNYHCIPFIGFNFHRRFSFYDTLIRKLCTYTYIDR